MSTTKRFVTFSGITFLFSWLLWLPVVILGLPTTSPGTGAVLFWAGGFGPSLVGAIYILASRPRQRPAELIARVSNPSRIGVKWTVVALFFYPLAFILSVLIAGSFGSGLPEMGGWTAASESPWMVARTMIMILLLGPVSEEIGWRGYALPLLQREHSPIIVSLIIGAVWWAWHIPLFFMEGTLHASQGILSAFSAGYLVTVLSYSVWFTWIYSHTRSSILVAILAHFSVNATIAMASPFEPAIFAIATVILAAGAFFLHPKSERRVSSSVPSVST